MEVTYSTNIMGECPWEFSIKLNCKDNENLNLKSVKPEYN
jgi:hypothetical protein